MASGDEQHTETWDVDDLPGLDDPESLSRLERAALEAELDTGEREKNLDEARAGVRKRVLRISAGFIVLILGIIAIPFPGPGWLIVVAGLRILAEDFLWAEKLMRYIRKRIPGIPEDGKIPRNTMIMMITMVVVFSVVAFFWGSDIKNWVLGFTPWG